MNRSTQFWLTERTDSKPRFRDPPYKQSPISVPLYRLFVERKQIHTRTSVSPCFHRPSTPPQHRGSRPSQGNLSRFVRISTGKLSAFSHRVYDCDVSGASEAAYRQPMPNLFPKPYGRQLSWYISTRPVRCVWCSSEKERLECGTEAAQLSALASTIAR